MKKPKKARDTMPSPGAAEATPQAPAMSSSVEVAEAVALADAPLGAPALDVADGFLDDDAPPVVVRDPELKVSLSKQLHLKLLRMAQDEGVALESLVLELLAEGVTLRAWEIIERKSTMRGGPSSGHQVPGGGQGFNGHGNHRHGNHQGNHSSQGNRNQSRRPSVNNSWMEDKAAFLEYVRNQEKQRRR